MKFSLIVPVYNVENYLDKCLNSIFLNNYKDYEVIIVNDGSTDNSEKIINEYVSKYSNIVYIKQKNKGLSSARNAGVKKAKGDYILFIDSDDYIEKDLLNTLNKNLTDSPDILRYQLREIYDDRKVDCNEIGFDSLKGIKAFSKITKYKYIEVAVLYVYKTSFFKKNKFSFQEKIYHEDFALIPIIISKADMVKSINYIGYNYVNRKSSIMNDNDEEKIIKKMDDCIFAYKSAIELLSKVKESDDVINFYSNSVIEKYNNLPKKYKKKYKSVLKELKVFDYLLNNSLKRKIKKLVYKIKFEVNL